MRRLWQGKRLDLGFATRSAIEKMVVLGATEEKEEHFAKAAELIMISDAEFARRLSAPVEVSEEQSFEA